MALKNQVVRDFTDKSPDSGWIVFFNNRFTTPVFQSKDAADIYLKALESGKRVAEYGEDPAVAVAAIEAARDDSICTSCGGTILPPAIAGAERGSCHCSRPGRLTAHLFYIDSDQAREKGNWRIYGVEWEGVELAVVPPTLTRAMEVLKELRAAFAAGTEGAKDV